MLHTSEDGFSRDVAHKILIGMEASVGHRNVVMMRCPESSCFKSTC